MSEPDDLIQEVIKLVRRGDHKAALDACNSELINCQSNASALRSRAYVYSDVGQETQRRDDLEAAYKLEPLHDGGIFLLSLCCLEQSDFARAACLAHQLSKSEHASAMIILAIAQKESGEFDKAKRSIASIPDSAQLRIGRKLVTKSSLENELGTRYK